MTRPLRDGERLEFRDRTLEVLHRPGHSPSDTVFWDEERRILIAADHLIKHISSNPLITRPLDGSGERTQALVIYLESMRKTREMPAEIVLSGHGEPITDHVALIDERFALHERRKEKIFGLIDEEPRTGYELAQAIWGNVAVTQAFLTLSEVIGHVDLLVNEGRVREVARAARWSASRRRVTPPRARVRNQQWPRANRSHARIQLRLAGRGDVGSRRPAPPAR